MSPWVCQYCVKIPHIKIHNHLCQVGSSQADLYSISGKSDVHVMVVLCIKKKKGKKDYDSPGVIFL